MANRAEVTPVATTTVEMAVNMPAALAALVALKLAQVAAPRGTAVVQRTSISEKRLCKDGSVLAVRVDQDGDKDQNKHGEYDRAKGYIIEGHGGKW